MSLWYLLQFESISSAPMEVSIALAFLSLFGTYVYRKLPILPKTGPERPKEILDALEKNEDIFYFGVGSNLSRTKMETRSVCGKKIGLISMEPCFIRNCRLAFNYLAIPPIEPAMGSLEPLPAFFDEKINGAADPPNHHNIERRDSKALVGLGYDGSECHGALIKLSAADYKLVYRSEGGDMGALSGYEEIMVDCVPYDKSKPTVKAVAYRVRPYRLAKQDLCPSKRYLTIIRDGAAELGLEESYQKWLRDHPVQNVSRITRKVGKYSNIFTFTLAMGFKIRLLSDVLNVLLTDVYALPTAPRWKQILSETASVVIMTPTAFLGFALKGLLEVSGKVPPEMKKWMEDVDNESP